MCAGSTQQHWPFPDSHVDLGYAYLFTHPGNPTIFWDHYFDNGYKVRSSQLRHSAEQNCIHHSSPSYGRGPAMHAHDINQEWLHSGNPLEVHCCKAQEC